MNKKLTLAIIAVVVVLVAAGGIFFWYRQTHTVTIAGSNQTASGTTSDTTVGTYAEILALGKNVKCDYTNSDTDGSTSGTLYIKSRGEAMRADFTLAKSDNTSTTSHIVYNGNTEYIWSDNEKDGIKATLTDEDKKNIFSDTTTQDSGIGPNEKLTCRAATIGNDLLTPPTDVNFIDFSATNPSGY